MKKHWKSNRHPHALDDGADYYLCSEADAVIAELRGEIEALRNDDKNWKRQFIDLGNRTILQLATKDATIAKLTEFAREMIFPHIPQDRVAMSRQLDSILGERPKTGT